MKNGADYARKVDASAAVFSFARGSAPSKTTSGDSDFDEALAVSLRKLSDMFGVLPGFEFYQEEPGEGANAYATSQQRYSGRPDGTVAYGRRLLASQFNGKNSRGVASAQVVSTCAHEFGHILQFKRGVMKRLQNGDFRSRRIELHADFLAGYFAGVRKREKPDFPAAEVALDLYNAGDNVVQDPGHHGTQRERGDAVVMGFKAAYNEQVEFNIAFDRGLAYFRTA